MREAPLLSFVTAPAVTESTQIYSVGHSTRSEADFLALLRSFQIVQLADIRTLPGSNRHPQFNSQNLEAVLPKLGIGYAHLPKLGGLRRGLGPHSPNRGWRNANFRGYADHMLNATARSSPTRSWFEESSSPTSSASLGRRPISSLPSRKWMEPG